MIGEASVFLNRMFMNVSRFTGISNFAILLFLGYKANPVILWVAVVGVPAMIIYTIIDILYIAPKEYLVQTRLNPFMVKMEKDISLLHDDK